MIKDILGVLSDFIGILFVWWQPETLAWHWKVIISAVLSLFAIAFVFLSRSRPLAKIKDYSWKNKKDIMLFLNKNTYYSPNMLVSIFSKENNQPTLCAIGYVKPDPEDKILHIQVLQQIDTCATEKIRSSAKSYKKFFILPYVTANDISSIEW